MEKSYLNLQPHLCKWIIHINQQARRKRLALICGAGISVDAKIPMWKKLVERIARSIEDIPNETIKFFRSGYNPTFLTQIAYEHFIRSQKIKTERDRIIAEECWARIVHNSLYKDCDESMDNILSKHPYLQELAKLAFKCPQVLTFNFDNLLSEAMQVHASKVTKAGGEQMILPDVSVAPGLIEKPDATTIFHINGLLPRNLQRKRSEQLVFTENAFADAMISTNTIEFNHILFNLSNYTNLIIGHSLDDASLKNLLRGTRKRTPAQLNYYIYWIDETDYLSKHVLTDIFNVNLEVYNLITIFATTSDIVTILNLINTNDFDFPTSLRDIGETKHRYLYYIVGPVASGKTSVLQHLRYFQTYEEWLDPVPPLLYINHHKLSCEERTIVEKWVIDQLDKKNRLMQRSETGFYFMDRAPLDALVFSASDEERKTKAETLSNCFKGSNHLVNAQIQFISANGSVLEERNIRRGRLPDEGGDVKYLEKQTHDLKNLYSSKNIYDTSAKIPGEIAREIAISALLDDHCETDLKATLKEELSET